jgi:hypothetical protein
VPEISKDRAAAQGLRLAGLDRRRSHPRSTCASASAAPTPAPRRSLETCIRKTRSLPDPQARLTIGTPASCLMSTCVRHQSLRPGAEASLTPATPLGAFRKLTFSSFTPNSAALPGNPHECWVPCLQNKPKTAASRMDACKQCRQIRRGVK